jgi:hypothetical protein
MPPHDPQQAALDALAVALTALAATRRDAELLCTLIGRPARPPVLVGLCVPWWGVVPICIQ